MSIVEFHARLGNTAVFYIIILAVWAFWRYFRKQGINSSYWGALAIAEVLILLQGGLGVYIWAIGQRPSAAGMHILYGVLSAIGIPVAFAFTRGREERREMLIYGAGLLFMTGLLVRAIATG
jgi:ABC-type spermidine/putrescine transport system permease subunit I